MSPKITPQQAIQAYVDFLNSLLNTVLTDSRLVAQGRGTGYIIDRFQDDEFLPLELSQQRFLHFRQFVRVVDSHIEVESYAYVYSMSPNRDDEEAWVCRYDYDRNPSDTGMPHAHIHINRESGEQWPLSRPLRRTHFPTLRVSVEHLVWFLISEGGVAPKLPYEEALKGLALSYEGFLKRRTDIQAGVFP